MAPGEFKPGARVRVVKPEPAHTHCKGREARLGNPSRGPRVPGKRTTGKMGSWWWVHIDGGTGLFRRRELELI